MQNKDDKYLTKELEELFPEDFEDMVSRATEIRDEINNLIKAEPEIIDQCIVDCLNYYPEHDFEWQKSYVYGSVCCSLYDKCECTGELDEMLYYEKLDNIQKHVKIEEQRDIIDLGIEESLFRRYIGKIDFPNEYLENFAQVGVLVGTNYFEQLRRIRRLENKIRTMYPFLREKLLQEDDKQSLAQRLSILTPAFISHNDFECLQIVAADYVISNTTIIASSDMSSMQEKLLHKYYHSNLLNEELKGPAGEEFIVESMMASETVYLSNVKMEYDKQEEEYLKALEKETRTYISYNNQQVDYMLSVQTEDIQRKASEFMKIMPYCEERFGRSPFLKRAVLLVVYYCLDDSYNTGEYSPSMEEYLSMVYGAIHGFQCESMPSEAMTMRNYDDEYSKRIQKLPEIPAFLDEKSVHKGIDMELYDTHQVEILQGGSDTLRKLSNNFYGLRLFAEADKLLCLVGIFKQTYPEAIIIDYDDGDVYVYPTSEWVYDCLIGHLARKDIDIHQCMEILSAEYFLNRMEKMSGELNLYDEDVSLLFKETNLIPKEYKTNLACQIVDLIPNENISYGKRKFFN